MAYIACSLKNGQGNIESRKFKVIMKIYFNANFERFTKFLNHKTLELYGIACVCVFKIEGLEGGRRGRGKGKKVGGRKLGLERRQRYTYTRGEDSHSSSCFFLKLGA